MKPQTFRYIFKEGFFNLFRNKLMFFVSSAIITAALMILGFFLLLIFNIDTNLKALEAKPQIRIYCRYDLLEEETYALEDEIKQIAGIKEFEFISKEEAYVRAQELLEEDADILNGMENDFLPVSFIIRLEDTAQIDDFVTEIEMMDGIDKIFYPKATIDFISRVSNWVKAFGLILVSIPMLFSVFIMSNTIKIAVFERKNEISIMRYIGATEQLIKWPFIVEGVLIGLIATAIAFILTNYGYMVLENSFKSEISSVSSNLLELVRVGSVSTLILLTYFIIGVGVGAIGSVQSIRKYLRV